MCRSCRLARFFPARRDTFQLALLWARVGQPGLAHGSACRERRLWRPGCGALGAGAGAGGGGVLWEQRVCARALGHGSVPSEGQRWRAAGAQPALVRSRGGSAAEAPGPGRTERLPCLLPSPGGHEASLRVELRALSRGQHGRRCVEAGPGREVASSSSLK